MMLDRQSSSFELTLSLFAVIVLLLGVSVWLLIPETKTYLHLQDETRTAVQTTDRIQMEYDRLYEEKASTEAEAAALSERFENRAEAEDVLAWVRKFLNEAEMVSAAPDGTFALRPAGCGCAWQARRRFTALSISLTARPGFSGFFRLLLCRRKQAA